MKSLVEQNRRLGRPLFRRPFMVAAWIVLICAALDWLVMGFLHRFRIPNSLAIELWSMIDPFKANGLAIIAALYGLYRVKDFLPMVDRKYERWLATTPWAAGMPLPKGPAQLVWEDAVVLGVITALSWVLAPTIPLIAFATAYSVVMLIGARSLLPAVVGYTMAFGGATVVLLWGYPRIDLLLVVGLTGLLQMALLKGLTKFPWQLRLAKDEEESIAMRSTKDWRMSPLAPQKPIPMVHGVSLALLAGWWVFCVMSRIPDAAIWVPDHSEVGVLILMAVFVGFLRWFIYCAQYQPPISTWGRLWTGRWIIPDYDYVLVSPLFTTSAGTLLAISLYKYGIHPPLTFAISTTVVLGCALNLAPTLRSWQLTGHHRIVVAGNVSGASQRRRVA